MPFHPDTRLLMFDGSIKAVSELVEGDQLMGADGQPRSVSGITHHPPGPCSTISPRLPSCDSSEAFTVSDDHALVLRITHRPVPEDSGEDGGTHSILSFQLDSAGVPHLDTSTFPTRAARDAALEVARANWQPLDFTITVAQLRGLPDVVQSVCLLTRIPEHLRPRPQPHSLTPAKEE
jgi:hypothetical protein